MYSLTVLLFETLLDSVSGSIRQGVIRLNPLGLEALPRYSLTTEPRHSEELWEFWI